MTGDTCASFMLSLFINSSIRLIFGKFATLILCPDINGIILSIARHAFTLKVASFMLYRNLLNYFQLGSTYYSDIFRVQEVFVVDNRPTRIEVR